MSQFHTHSVVTKTQSSDHLVHAMWIAESLLILFQNIFLINSQFHLVHVVGGAADGLLLVLHG